MASDTTDENVPTASDQPNASDNDLPRDGAPGGPLSGKLGVFMFLVLFSTAGYLTWHTMTHSEPDPPPITYICSETQKTFERKPHIGETIPVLSPYTNRKTGYTAEECFWTRDGKRKLEPTYVLLNKYAGKKGPTICPDCGKIVYPHNPPPPPETPLAAPPADATELGAAPSATTQPSAP